MPLAILAILIILAIAMIAGIIQLSNIIFRGHAPFVPTKRKVVKKIINEINLKPGQVFYELGCGDAGLLYKLSRKYPEAKLFGIEYALLPWLLANIQISFARAKIRIKKKNMFKVDLRPADYIYCFLNVETMAKLARKIKDECKNNAIVISYVFKLPGFKPEKTVRIDKHDLVYFYRIKK
ncbi:MAG: hypothetical protein V1865_02830 [bacterium]